MANKYENKILLIKVCDYPENFLKVQIQIQNSYIFMKTHNEICIFAIKILIFSNLKLKVTKSSELFFYFTKINFWEEKILMQKFLTKSIQKKIA